MAQFDILELRSSPGALVVLLQSDTTSDLGTRVVAPLFSSSDAPPLSQLHIRVSHDRQSFLVQVDRLASVPVKMLGPRVGTVRHHEDQLKRGLDLLFFGI